ncbi:hypothetical protein C2S52_011548 [Perilla frutescens var. hirtella]|nr:hypothetical protein C2S52_011548 [Perilla frutescens var. hirtella]
MRFFMFPTATRRLEIILFASFIHTELLSLRGRRSVDEINWCDSHHYFPIGIVLVASVLVISWISWTNRQKKREKMREDLFEQNGGNLLRKKLSKKKNIQLTMYTAQDIKSITNSYSCRNVELRDCNPGVFYSGTLSEDDDHGTEVAVVMIESVPRSKINQFVDQLVKLSHPHMNLVRIRGCCLETQSPLIVYELKQLCGGDAVTLFNCIRAAHVHLSCGMRVSAAAGIAKGLKSLNTSKIVHGNICTANILMDTSYNAKIFYAAGSSLITRDEYDHTSSSEQEKYVYKDPEFLNNKSDVYSFGVVLVELLTGGKKLSPNRSSMALDFVYLAKNDRLCEVIDEEMIGTERDGEVVTQVAALALRCLNVKPRKRPTINQVEAELTKLLVQQFLKLLYPNSKTQLLYMLQRPIIFEVDDRLRQVNVKDYEPQIVSIGPIHRHVKSMEQHKGRYLQQLLQKRADLSIHKFVEKLTDMEEHARQCYSTTSLNLNTNEFVGMLLLDGCFIIELIRKYFFDNDPIFESETLSQIRHDLMLFENQLPFFVLKQLFDMTKTEDQEDNIWRLTLFFVDDMFPWLDVLKVQINSTEAQLLLDADHLLGLVYRCFVPFSTRTPSKTRKGRKKSHHVHINSASELKEAGIRLKLSRKNSLTFKAGVLKLPPLQVLGKTESLLRNVMAYEQLRFNDDHPKHVTDYAFFMHCLIRSTKDIEILRRCGILSNYLGGDDKIYDMFDRLGTNFLRSSDFCYSDVFGSLNIHCGRRHKKWMANLWRDYFNSPWSLLSFCAATVLLLIAFTQMVFTVLTFTHRKNVTLLPHL